MNILPFSRTTELATVYLVLSVHVVVLLANAPNPPL